MVGIYADTSPACVSMIGRAVSEPPPSFLDRVKEYQNIGTAYVTSAFELSKEQKLAVEKRLLDTTKYVKFEMHFEVDTALIGGMKIRIGDRVVDSSVSSRLERLTRDLTKIQLKVGECAP